MPSLYFLPVVQTSVTWAVYTGIISLFLYLFVELPLKKIGKLIFEKKVDKNLVFEKDEGIEMISDGL